MASPCLHFRLLNNRAVELAAKFMDDQVAAEAQNPVTYVPDLDRVAAFRLLIHAEIEDFLEVKAKENLDAIASGIGQASSAARNFPELFSLSYMVGEPFPDVAKGFDQQRMVGYIQRVVQAAGKIVAENNGIKSGAFAFLSVCAGKVADEIDNVLSASLNSYGKQRGDVAHQSVTHVRTLQAPSAERSTALAIVAQLGSYFDVTP